MWLLIVTVFWQTEILGISLVCCSRLCVKQPCRSWNFHSSPIRAFHLFPQQSLASILYFLASILYFYSSVSTEYSPYNFYLLPEVCYSTLGIFCFDWFYLFAAIPSFNIFRLLQPIQYYVLDFDFSSRSSQLSWKLNSAAQIIIFLQQFTFPSSSTCR